MCLVLIHCCILFDLIFTMMTFSVGFSQPRGKRAVLFVMSANKNAMEDETQQLHDMFC